MMWRKPKRAQTRPGATLLKDLLNPTYPSCSSAGVLNWAPFKRQFGKFYVKGLGRPALATWLMMDRCLSDQTQVGTVACNARLLQDRTANSLLGFLVTLLFTLAMGTPSQADITFPPGFIP